MQTVDELKRKPVELGLVCDEKIQIRDYSLVSGFSTWEDEGISTEWKRADEGALERRIETDIQEVQERLASCTCYEEKVPGMGWRLRVGEKQLVIVTTLLADRREQSFRGGLPVFTIKGTCAHQNARTLNLEALTPSSRLCICLQSLSSGACKKWLGILNLTLKRNHQVKVRILENHLTCKHKPPGKLKKEKQKQAYFVLSSWKE